MSSWDIILDNFPPEQQLQLTDLEEAYIPVYTTEAFAADYKETQCLFARFLTPGILVRRSRSYLEIHIEQRTTQYQEISISSFPS